MASSDNGVTVYLSLLYFVIMLLLTLLYFILLRFRRGSTPGFCNTVVAVMAFNHFVLSAMTHTYLLYGEKFDKNATLDIPSFDGNVFSYFKRTVSLNFLLFGHHVDSRIFLDEYAPFMKAIFGIGSGVIGSILSFATALEHLKGCSVVYTTQTISVVWNIAMAYCWFVPELLDGLKHLINPLYLAGSMIYLFFYAFFAIGGSYCATGKLGKSAGMVCSPIAPVKMPLPAKVSPPAPTVAKPAQPPPARGGKDKPKKH